MNKIYKVIWSEVRRVWVVVSEIARNHGAKGRSIHDGRKGASLLAGAVLLVLLLGNGTVWAGTTVNDYGMFTKGLTIGDQSDTNQGYLTSYSPASFWGPVTFYNDVTFANGFTFSDLVINGMHIDYNNASHSFSIGSTYHKNNTSNYTISLGETFGGGDYSFVAGNQAQAGKYSVVIGSSANGVKPYTVVLGPNTQAESSSIVLGNGAKTYRNNGIAIGAAAVDDSGNVITAGALAGDSFSIAIGTGSDVNQGGQREHRHRLYGKEYFRCRCHCFGGLFQERLAPQCGPAGVCALGRQQYGKCGKFQFQEQFGFGCLEVHQGRLVHWGYYGG
ncbi:MAG: ESPR-type extended signal peptide-containing protein [Succiniclasticum sp.]|nr:ESPR-type extended signal peptide-containing protein [Succiniclasticum sp.]